MFVRWRQTRGGRIAAAVSSGAAARVLSSLVALISLPPAVRYLGVERFGLWATIASTVVFLNLLDLGIASSLTNHIAYSHAVEDRQNAARAITNALALTAAAAASAGGVLAFVWARINWMDLFSVSARVPRGEVNATVAVAIALILIGLPVSLSNRVLAGYQQVHLSNLLVVAATLANLAGLLAGIGLKVSMPVLFVLATGWTTMFNLAALAAIVAWQKPWLRPRMRLLEWAAVREMLSTGSGFLLIQIAGAVVFSSDNVVVSHYLGPAQVTPYNVTWRLVGLGAVMQALLFPALWPAYAEAHARGDYIWMRRTFHLTFRGTLAVNLAFGVALFALGQPLIRWWAGAAAVPSRILLAAMALWGVISGAMTVESCLLAAVNHTREQGLLSVVAAAVNLALSVFLVQRIGAAGVIAGTLLSYVLVLVVPQSLLVRSVLRTADTKPAMGGISRQPVASCQ
jgi:O-antigen/teichoic acid export membrane protein